MFVVSDYTFTPDAGGGYDEIVLPGVYGIERFISIENATRNDVLYSATGAHLGSIVVSNDGLNTTVLVYAAEVGAQAADKIRILIYDPTPTGSGPSSNVSITNWPASQNINGSVSVSNFPATQAVTGTFWQAVQPVSGSVSVSNLPAVQSVSGTVNVGNFPATQSVTQGTDPWVVSGTVDVSSITGTVTVGGNVTVDNFPATQPVSGSVTVSGTVDVGNFPTSFDVGNFPATQAVTGTFWQTTQPVSGTVTANQGTSPWIVSSTGGSTNVASFPSTSTDAFGRLRVSQPYTMFDSQHRYADNNLWSTSTATGGTAVFNAAQGLMDLNVTADSGSQVLRETVRTFAYQPGKSLQVMTTFVMAPPKTGLTQRVGYYNVGNGFFVELNDNLASLCFVERSSVTGSVTNTRISQLGGVYGAGDTGWNVDPMNGTGPSGITLDITKAQILWMDIEWLGVGTVRMGFVINGQFYICHEWDHANLITSTYITTASLPMRCEILNVAATTGPSTFKQICGTVISEGGYVLTGSQQSIGTPIVTPRTLTVAGVAYPMVSLRLKSTKLDAICILSAVSVMGNGNNEKFQWNLEQDDAVIGGTWVSAGPDSAVEYNLTATSTSGGRTLGSGYISSSNQGSPTVNIFKADLFQFQLERNPFTNTPYSLTLTLAGANNTTSAYTSMDWEEVCR